MQSEIGCHALCDRFLHYNLEAGLGTVVRVEAGGRGGAAMADHASLSRCPVLFVLCCLCCAVTLFRFLCLFNVDVISCAAYKEGLSKLRETLSGKPTVAHHPLTVRILSCSTLLLV